MTPVSFDVLIKLITFQTYIILSIISSTEILIKYFLFGFMRRESIKKLESEVGNQFIAITWPIGGI